MKKIFMPCFLFVNGICTAQINANSQWTWVKGDTTEMNFGVYGQPGIAGPGNKPGGRSGSVSWADTTGNV